jgi:hypothetical protein
VSIAQQTTGLQAQVKALNATSILTGKQANILLAELSLKGNSGDIGKVGSFLNDVAGLPPIGRPHPGAGGRPVGRRQHPAAEPVGAVSRSSFGHLLFRLSN